MIELRPLTGMSWGALAAGFEAAFSDYAVPMKMTADALAAMQRRRGYDPAHSFGAFAGAELVGFSFTCVDGDRAYDSGTGVVPAFRRGGLARRLVEAAIASVAAAAPPVRTFVLEVLEHNAPAVALYRSLGFTETRRLQCWTYAAPPAPLAHPGALPRPEPQLTRPEPRELASLLAEAEADPDLVPAWQNTLASIRRAPDPHLVLGDEHGLVIVFPRTADLPLLYVRRASRRRGHGLRLLATAAAALAAAPDPSSAASPAGPRSLRIINLDDRVASVSAFLSAAGATRTVRQLEMSRILP